MKKVSNIYIFKELKKYSSCSDLLNSKQAKLYYMARRRNILDEATRHFPLKHIIKKEDIFKSALNYFYKKDWINNDVNYYNAAVRKGILEEATKHMKPLGNMYKRCLYIIKFKNTKLVYIGITYNFNKRIAQHKLRSKFSNLIKFYGSSKFKVKKVTRYISTEKAILLEQRLINFYKNRNYKVLNSRSAGAIGGNNQKWNYETIKEEIKKYKSYSEWIQKGRPSYEAAVRLGLHKNENLISHLKKNGSNGRVIWNKNTILQEAKKFTQAGIFAIKSPGAYQASFKLGLYRYISNKMNWRKNFSKTWRNNEKNI